QVEYRRDVLVPRRFDWQNDEPVVALARPRPRIALLDAEDANRSAWNDHAGITGAIPRDQRVDRIAVRSVCRGHEAPIVGVREACRKWSRQHDPVDRRVVFELDGGAARRLHEDVQGAVGPKCGQHTVTWRDAFRGRSESVSPPRQGAVVSPRAGPRRTQATKTPRRQR